jgi:hypothetical protein
MSADPDQPRIPEDAKSLRRQSGILRSGMTPYDLKTAASTREAVERSRKLLKDTEHFNRVPPRRHDDR